MNAGRKSGPSRSDGMTREVRLLEVCGRLRSEQEVVMLDCQVIFLEDSLGGRNHTRLGAIGTVQDNLGNSAKSDMRMSTIFLLLRSDKA